tara:strand:- start:8123 stop:8452 length:330 start_codon:yes stop_codon:yes gene_type:complete
MDLCIYKINNGYKIGKRDGSRLDEQFGKRYYITKRPMRRDPAKKLLMKLQLAEKGIVMNVKSKKKQRTLRDNGFIRIDAIYSKKKKRDSQAKQKNVNFFNFNLTPINLS